MQEVPSKPLSRECLREGIALGSSPLTPVRSQLEVAGVGRGEVWGTRGITEAGAAAPSPSCCWLCLEQRQAQVAWSVSIYIIMTQGHILLGPEA